MRGDEFVGSGGASAEAQEFLRSLGVANDDVSVAVGFGAAPDGGSGVAVFAFRAEGADSVPPAAGDARVRSMPRARLRSNGRQ